MYDPNEQYQDDLDKLLDQVDELLLPREPVNPNDDFDPDDYAPRDDYDEPVVIQNYSNGYGAQIRNYSNNYGAGTPAREEPEVQAIPAYNADFRRPDVRNVPRQSMDETRVIQNTSYQSMDETRVIRNVEDIPVAYRNADPEIPAKPAEEKLKKQKKKKKRGCLGCGCAGLLTMVGVVVLCAVLVMNWFFVPPMTEQAVENRKRDTATVLICGTDKDGTRTDTMMLLYMSGSDRQIGLLSLPRDTYTITSRGDGAKLNSAYGRNGTGESGMEGLLDYVQEIIGYRPDGYILVDMELVPQIVDAMGGLDVEVPMSFDLAGIHLDAGFQHLEGEEVLQLLRFRKGYNQQDLDRIKVQRAVITAALEQWLDAGHLENLGAVLELVENNSLTNLEMRNFLWMGKTVLMNMKNLQSDTLPGYATYIGDVSYYVLYRQDVADLLNERYNPSRNEILAENLKIAG